MGNNFLDNLDKDRARYRDFLEKERIHERELTEKSLDFQIEKAQTVLIEANKAETAALLSYLTLIIATTLFVFGDHFGITDADGKVTLPLTGSKVNQYAATTVTLFLSYAAMYWFYANNIMGRLISAKLGDLYYRRYRGQIKSGWHLQHPSLFGLGGILFGYRPVANPVQGTVFFVFLGINFLYPFVLATILSFRDHDDGLLRVSLILGTFLSILPSASAIRPIISLSTAINKLETSSRPVHKRLANAMRWLDKRFDVTPIEVDSIDDVPEGQTPLEV